MSRHLSPPSKVSSCRKKKKKRKEEGKEKKDKGGEGGVGREKFISLYQTGLQGQSKIPFLHIDHE